jgi:hypothetical protein
MSLDNELHNRQQIVPPACLHLLTGAGDSLACHFALATISKSISISHGAMTASEWLGLKTGLLGLFNGAQDLPFFVMSKLIDVMADVAIRTWPSDWPELLPGTLGSGNKWGFCLFARICDSLSEESLSVRCIAPERQLSLRTGIATVAEQLVKACYESVKSPDAALSPVFQWILELINGLCVATKQSSYLVQDGMHGILISAFMETSDANIKMLCVETLSNFIHYLAGQSGRAYTLERGTREQDFSLLQGILETCTRLLEPDMISTYYDDSDMRDSLAAFFDLLTDIRKTANTFSYFPDLTVYYRVLKETAIRHPSVQVQISALTNVDALVRSKQVPSDRDALLVCFMACHDFYSCKQISEASIPTASLLPHVADPREVARRRELCVDECEDEGLKVGEVIGKLKNAALLCIRHISMISDADAVIVAFLQEVLSNTISPDGSVSKSYYPSLLITEAVATAVTHQDSKLSHLTEMINILSSNCPAGKEQDYLWFLSKAGGFISQEYLGSVFDKVLRMDLARNFQAQVAFISLCKTNSNSAHFVGELHNALQSALGGESRSWAIGAILSACAHGGVGAADNFALTVFNESVGKLNDIANETTASLEDFSKRSTPIFATFKSILEVALSQSVSCQIADQLAQKIIPFCWTKLMRSPGVFEVGPNEFLSVLGSQFLQSANSASATHVNAAFQLYMLVTQVAGLCVMLSSSENSESMKALGALFDPSWNLRASLINILVSSVISTAASVRPSLVLTFMIPDALTSLHTCATIGAPDDFTGASLSKAAVAIVNCVLTALQITTDDELFVSDYTGAPKAAMTQRQLKAQVRSRNRFAGISEEATKTSSSLPMGHRIPRELVGEPDVVFRIVAKCLEFRFDKAFRRINQSIPTIVTRWWNTVSNDSQATVRFASVLPDCVVRPLLTALAMVRTKDACTLPGGQLHSYTCERAVSGRRLPSEFVDHATISIHGVLVVLWRICSAHAPRGMTDPLVVVEAPQPLKLILTMLQAAAGGGSSETLVRQLVSFAQEQSLESRAALKFMIERLSKPHNGDARQSATGDSISVQATSRDMIASSSGITAVVSDEQGPPGNLFDH